MIRQAVILVGGLGTRLGALTQSVPKPLLPVDGRPFLDILIQDVARFGFTRIVLLAGHLGGQFVEGFAGTRRIAGRDVEIRVVVEPTPAGTGGALRFLAPHAEDRFLLLNGDTWCDLDLRAFADAPGDALLRMALRPVADASRYGTVALEAGRVRAFLPRGAASGGVMNAGIYRMRRDLIAMVGEGACSLEADIFPRLAAAGEIEGVVRDAFMIDIGVPDDYAAAQHLLDRHRRRPAIFFDRDETLNFDDKGYTHRPEDLRWLPGAREAVRRVNEAGFFAFVITNQSGIARGHYDHAAVDRFHARMEEELAAVGAHIDEFRLSPFHPDGAVEAFRAESPCRKPRPGMILDLMRDWPVDAARSLVIGDRETDVQAAENAGLRGVLLRPGDSPLDLLAPYLPARGPGNALRS